VLHCRALRTTTEDSEMREIELSDPLLNKVLVKLARRSQAMAVEGRENEAVNIDVEVRSILKDEIVDEDEIERIIDRLRDLFEASGNA
jgi:hypothetical protein